jgi:hypothetical protein
MLSSIRIPIFMQTKQNIGSCGLLHTPAAGNQSITHFMWLKKWAWVNSQGVLLPKTPAKLVHTEWVAKKVEW